MLHCSKLLVCKFQTLRHIRVSQIEQCSLKDFALLYDIINPTNIHLNCVFNVKKEF